MLILLLTIWLTPAIIMIGVNILVWQPFTFSLLIYLLWPIFPILNFIHEW